MRLLTSLKWSAVATFILPKHEIIFDALLNLYSHGEPTDVITVSEELTKTGMLSRAGGVDYLHSIVSVVPTAASAGHYAAIVADKAVLASAGRRRYSDRQYGLRERR
jgi:replicative DNA helicase